MQYQEITKEEEYDNLVKEIADQSEYRELPTGERKTMSVVEMGKLLGLHKTDRYWLVHKGFFKTEYIAGQMRVDLESFEKWYANQVKYHKITGEEPGLELKKTSYSARDIAQMLQVGEERVYDWMKKDNVPYILVDYWKRFPKEAFDEWYRKQNHFRNQEDREAIEDMMANTMSMPEMARLLGIKRERVYYLLERNPDAFEIIHIGDMKRVTKESFYEWYGNQHRYHIVAEKTPAAMKKEKNRKIAALRMQTIDRDGSGKNIGNKDYLTIQEAAMLAGVQPGTISKWIKKKWFSYVKSGSVIRIHRADFEKWLKSTGKKGE